MLANTISGIIRVIPGHRIDMLRKSTFFDFFIRHETMDFDRFMAESTEDEHYINWNGYVLPMHCGDAEAEYSAIRQSCAIFDGTPFRKVRIQGSGAGRFLDHLVTRPVSVLATMLRLLQPMRRSRGACRYPGIQGTSS